MGMPRACAARSTSRYSSRPTIIRHSFARTWHDTRSPRCFRGAARPATRTRGRSGRSPAPRSAGAAGRGPCPRTATWPMRHRRRAGSADRTWPPGSHRVTRSDVGPATRDPGRTHRHRSARSSTRSRDARTRRSRTARSPEGYVTHTPHTHTVSVRIYTEQRTRTGAAQPGNRRATGTRRPESAVASPRPTPTAHVRAVYCRAV